MQIKLLASQPRTRVPVGNVQLQFMKQETDVFCIVTLCGLEWGGRKGMIAKVRDILQSKGLLAQRIISNTCHLLPCFSLWASECFADSN